MITLILPTLGQREFEIKRLFNSLENQTYNNFEVIIVSQDNHDDISEYLKNYKFKYKHIRINKKGLSIARNEGLKHVNGDIITFSDDDCWYLNDSLENVHNYFEKNKSDIALFQHFDPDKLQYSKKYPTEEKKNIHRLRILSQSSIDIFINIKNVRDYIIGFDERFGIGGKYKSGEENVYLMDLYNKGYKLDYYPKIISYHPNKRGNGNNILDEKMVIDKAPLFKRLFGNPIGIVMYTAFMIKKRKVILNKKRCFINGVKEYINF